MQAFDYSPVSCADTVHKRSDTCRQPSAA